MDKSCDAPIIHFVRLLSLVCSQAPFVLERWNDFEWKGLMPDLMEGVGGIDVAEKGTLSFVILR